MTGSKEIFKKKEKSNRILIFLPPIEVEGGGQSLGDMSPKE